MCRNSARKPQKSWSMAFHWVKAVRSDWMWWCRVCPRATSGTTTVSDSPLTTSIRPAASHLLLLTPRETDLTLHVRSCTLRMTQAQVRKKKNSHHLPFTSGAVCLSGALEKKWPQAQSCLSWQPNKRPLNHLAPLEPSSRHGVTGNAFLWSIGPLLVLSHC